VRENNGRDTKNPVRPFLNPAFHGNPIVGKVSEWYNPAAFLAPPNGSGFYGNLGRDALTGPGIGAWDYSMFKDASLRERLHLQFRAEFFNILNHSNFNTPNLVSSRPRSLANSRDRDQHLHHIEADPVRRQTSLVTLIRFQLHAHSNFADFPIVWTRPSILPRALRNAVCFPSPRHPESRSAGTSPTSRCTLHLPGNSASLRSAPGHRRSTRGSRFAALQTPRPELFSVPPAASPAPEPATRFLGSTRPHAESPLPAGSPAIRISPHAKWIRILQSLIGVFSEFVMCVCTPEMPSIPGRAPIPPAIVS